MDRSILFIAFSAWTVSPIWTLQCRDVAALVCKTFLPFSRVSSQYLLNKPPTPYSFCCFLVFFFNEIIFCTKFDFWLCISNTVEAACWIHCSLFLRHPLESRTGHPPQTCHSLSFLDWLMLSQLIALAQHKPSCRSFCVQAIQRNSFPNCLFLGVKYSCPLWTLLF